MENFDLTIPAGTSLAIAGQNGAGKTTLAKLLCRLYDPQEGRIEIDGDDLRNFDLESWRSRITVVFQDFIRLELPLRDHVAPKGAPDYVIHEVLEAAGAKNLASLTTVLSKGYAGGTELSGGQWQRVALARALVAVKTGAGLVLLDEPTAQLDVRGEAEIFERLLTASVENVFAPKASTAAAELSTPPTRGSPPLPTPQPEWKPTPRCNGAHAGARRGAAGVPAPDRSTDAAHTCGDNR